MAEVNKISSFKSFSEIKAQDAAARLKEENENKKKQTLSRIEEILDEMGLSDLSELDEDSQNGLITRILGKDANEGNAFIYAAAKAKQDGNNEFEFQGKTYKVTLKKDTGLKESVELIAEATRSQFGKIDKRGNITSTYVHNDGYPSHMVSVIKGYKAKDVDTILNLGKAGISFLDKEIGDKHDFNKPKKGWTIFYGRDRNETGDTTTKDSIKNIEEYLKDVANDAGAEYVYLYDERDGKWYGADTYNDRDLKPVEQLSESVITEGKGDFMARHSGTNITLKKGYKHHTEEELTNLYNKIGELVKDDLKIKDVTIVFESVVTEGRVKQFEMDLEDMIKDIKRGYGWIDPEFVADTWENTSDSIDFELVDAEIYKRLIAAGLLAYADENNEEAAGKKVKSLKELGIKESVVNEATSFKVGDKVEITKFIQDAEHDETGHLYDFNPGVKVEITNADKHSYQFKYLDKLPNERYWAFRKEFKANVIKESVVTEGVSRDTKIYQIATPAPKAMLVGELENLFGDDYRHIVTEFDDDEGYESVLIFNLTKKDIQRIQNKIADVLIWEYSIKKGKEITESVVNEDARIVLVDPDTNKQLKTVIFSGPNRDADKEVEKLNGKLTSSQKQKGLYWTITTYESTITESHFKVGDKVEMSHGGTGVIVSLDKEDGAEDEKYYSVELPTGEIHKHSPNELTKVVDESITEGAQDIMRKMKDIVDTRAKIMSDYMKKFPTVWNIETKFSSSIAKKMEELQAKYNQLKADLNIAESVVTEASKSNLKKGDKLKFTETGEIIFIIEPKGDGYDFKMASDPREKDHAPKGWFDMMIKRGKLVSESVVTEAEINTDEEFKEYAFTVLKKAFQKDFDQAKANDVVDGILTSAKDDYGVAIGMLVKSLG